MGFFVLQLILLSAFTHAEFRAFEIVISDPTSGRERVEISSLDPNQFRRYYNVKASEKVTYRSTWMCRGNTSGLKPICLKPEKKN